MLSDIIVVSVLGVLLIVFCVLVARGRRSADWLLVIAVLGFIISFLMPPLHRLLEAAGWWPPW